MKLTRPSHGPRYRGPIPPARHTDFVAIPKVNLVGAAGLNLRPCRVNRPQAVGRPTPALSNPRNHRRSPALRLRPSARFGTIFPRGWVQIWVPIFEVKAGFSRGFSRRLPLRSPCRPAPRRQHRNRLPPVRTRRTRARTCEPLHSHLGFDDLRSASRPFEGPPMTSAPFSQCSSGISGLERWKLRPPRLMMPRLLKPSSTGAIEAPSRRCEGPSAFPRAIPCRFLPAFIRWTTQLSCSSALCTECSGNGSATSNTVLAGASQTWSRPFRNSRDDVTIMPRVHQRDRKSLHGVDAKNRAVHSGR